MLHSVHIPLRIQKEFPDLGISYRECRPESRFDSIVAYFWILRFDDVDYPVRTTPPDGGADIVIPLNNPVQPVLFGQSASFFSVPAGRSHNVFGIRLNPGAVRILFQIPAELLTGEAVPLSSLVLPRVFLEYLLAMEAEEISGTSLFQDAVCAAGRWLDSCLPSVYNSRDSGEDRLPRLLELMRYANPGTTVDSLTDLLALSPRQTERLFRNVCGLSPKAFLRINRFQHALSLKNRSEEISWSDLAQVCGYYDQSHLCRDFKAFAGKSPRDFFGGLLS